MDFARILLVDDDADDADIARRAFTKAGFNDAVAAVPDGPGALDYLRRSAEAGRLPGLVLLDMHLGAMDGVEVLRELRADRRLLYIPVVVLSGTDEVEDIRRSYAAGACGYVKKPRTAEEYLVTARHVGMYWLELNRTAPPDVRSPANLRRS